MKLNGSGPAGFMNGEGSIRLADAPGGTALTYDLDTQVGGRLAGVGQRLLESSARSITRLGLEGLARELQRTGRIGFAPEGDDRDGTVGEHRDGRGHGVAAALQQVEHADGLVLVAGPRSSGKSALLSAFVDVINVFDARTFDDYIYVEDRPGHDRRYAMDGSKLAALGWRAQTTFEEGLARTIDWFVDNEPWWRAARSRRRPSSWR